MKKDSRHPANVGRPDEPARVVQHATHEWATPGELTDTVVHAVARAAGVEPIDLEPLNESIDPDALNAIFHPRPDGTERSSDCRLRFTTNGYHVVVSGDGTVRVTERTPADQ